MIKSVRPILCMATAALACHALAAPQSHEMNPQDPMTAAGAHWIGAPASQPAQSPDLDWWIKEINAGKNFYFRMLDKEGVEDGRARAFIDGLLRDLKPALYFRREFEVAKPVRRATLHSSGLGWHEVFLDGERVDDRRFDPRRTDFDQRALFVTRDLTDSLQPGTHTLGVLLADGWYAQNVGFTEPGHDYRYGDPGLIASLHLEYEDGTTETLVTDRDWKWASSPILASNMFSGEVHDARRALPDWSKSGFDDQDWQKAQILAPRSPRLFPMTTPPERTHETLEASEIRPLGEDEWLFDFGRNAAAIPQLTLRNTKPGQRISIQYAQTLDIHGTPDPFSMMGPGVSGVRETDVYICRGAEEETWQPRFVFHGFRYAVVSGLNSKPDTETLKAVRVHTDIPVTGKFKSDNALLNQIDDVMAWTTQSLIHGTVDAMAGRERDQYIVQAMFNQRHLLYRFDSAAVWRESLTDFTTNRDHTGEPAAISPGNREEILPGDMRMGVNDYTLAPAILAHWDYYVFTGDRSPLEAHYDFLRDCLGHFRRSARSPDSHIVRGLGDWLDSKVGKTEPADGVDGPTVFQTSTYITGTTLYAASAMTLAKIAEVLGKQEDATQYRQLANEIAAELQDKYYDRGQRTFGSQAADAMALFYEVAPKEDKDAILESIERDIVENHNGHLSTGFFGTYPLLHVLTANGKADLAVDIMTKTTYPSYGDMITNYDGADMLEGWNDMRINDRHWKRGRLQMEGSSAGEWFFTGLAGIQPDPEEPGFRHFYLKPSGTGKLGKAGAEIQIPTGLVRSFWTVKKGRFTWEVVIPGESESTLSIPGSAIRILNRDTKEESVPDSPVVRLKAGRYEIHSTL